MEWDLFNQPDDDDSHEEFQDAEIVAGDEEAGAKLLGNGEES